MPYYTAYGLGIDSVLTLPELVSGAKQIDLVIKWEQIVFDSSAVDTTEFYYWRKGKEIVLHWQELGTFSIRNGSEIIIDAPPEIEEKNLHPALLGACMAVVLHQRGFLILHASAVSIQERVIAFVGDKGWGKSTMAVSLTEKGYQLVTDDVLAIDLNGDLPLVFPSFPQLKLCPDALESIGKDPETLPRVMPQVKKRQYRLDREFSIDPIPLQSIYLLNKGNQLSINQINSKDKILPLLAHSYGARFGKKLLHLGEKQHFLQCTELVNQIGIYHLQRPSDLSLMPQIADLVIQHSR